MKNCKKWLLLLPLLFLFSCSSTFKIRDEYVVEFQQGNVERAKNLTEKISCCHYQKSKEAVWQLLDKATIQFANGNIAEATKNYNFAIEAIDFYNQDLVTETLTKTLLEDSCQAYKGADFEQSLAHVYFAFCLLHKGDLGNATAILKACEDRQQRKKELYSKSSFKKDYLFTENLLAKYLLALCLEKRGDFSNAEILYKQALQSELIAHPNLLLVCHNGNVPYKISAIESSSIASTVALEILLSCHNLQPTLSTPCGLPVPKLYQHPFSYPIPFSCQIDNQPYSLTPFYDVAFQAYDELSKDVPIIMARNVTRYLIRKSFVAYAEKQDPFLGALTDIGMLVANLNTQADTRSWSTLPSRIDLFRGKLDKGIHKIEIFSQNFEICLKDKDLCIIHIFYLHPGVIKILIPEHNLIRR